MALQSGRIPTIGRQCTARTFRPSENTRVTATAPIPQTIPDTMRRQGQPGAAAHACQDTDR